MSFRRHCVELVTQPEIELQPGRHAKVVLSVEGEIGESHAETGFRDLIEVRRGIIGDQIGNRVEEVHAARQRLEVDVALCAPHPEAGLESIPPTNVSYVVIETEQIVVLRLWGIGRLCEGQAEDVDPRQCRVACRIQRNRLGTSETVGSPDGDVGAPYESESRLVKEMRRDAVNFRKADTLQPGAVAGKCIQIERPEQTERVAERIAREEIVIVGETVIETRAEIGLANQVGGGREVARGAVAVIGSGRQRVFVDQRLYRRAGLGASGKRGHACVGIHSNALPQAFERSEEEGTVLADGAADGAAEEVVTRRRPGNAVGVVEEVVGVQIAVAKELEAAAVKLVSTAPGAHIDNRAGEATELRGLHLCLHLELGDGIDRYQRNAAAGLTNGRIVARRQADSSVRTAARIHIDSVDQNIVGEVPLAVDIERAGG